MILRRLIPLMMFLPAVAPAISREMQELMRDVALLQQQVKDLQQSQDTKFAALTVMVQQTLDSATKANTAVAVLESGLGREEILVRGFRRGAREPLREEERGDSEEGEAQSVHGGYCQRRRQCSATRARKISVLRPRTVGRGSG